MLDAPLCDDRLIWDAWLSVYRMPAISAADELRLFEALNEAPATAAELADRRSLNPSALKSILPLLAAQGLLTVRQGRYHLSDTARTYLLHDSPLYWGHAFSVVRSTNPLHARLLAALKLAPALAPDGGSRAVEAWATGELGDEMARGLTAFMHSHSVPAALGAARNGDFEGVTRLLDVGGGSGCFAIALAAAHPRVRCTVMELPAVCELAKGYIAAAGLSERIDTRTVDMFREAWPSGYDAIFMSNIFHDWDEVTNAALAASAFAALPSGGRIYLHEMVLADDGSGPVHAASFSAMMLVDTKGRQYSSGELAGFLEGAGFSDVGVAETYGYYSLISAHKR